MGIGEFFSHVVEGAKSAGGWVLNHAGDIAGVVGTVAKVAGMLVPLDDASGDFDHQAHLDSFHTNFKIASSVLQHSAKAKALESNSNRVGKVKAEDFAATTPVYDTLTGVWKSPAPLDGQGVPSVSMYQDLSKWLATLGVPASAIDDATTAIAEGIFPDVQSARNGDIHTTSCPYTPADGSFILNCGHAFYHLPLGATSQEKCWHSCIYAKFHPSKQHLEAKRINGAGQTTILNKLRPGAATWVVNAIINWGNAAVATALHAKLNEEWMRTQGKAGDRIIIVSNILGVNQNIQIQGSPGDNPSGLRQSLINSAANVLSSQGPQSGKGGDASSGGSSGGDGGIIDGTDDFSHAPTNGTKAARNVHASNAADISSGMPLMVPEVRITKSQLVYAPDTGKHM
ncbi:hypothetical protein PG993_010485 [Apiospora rasikravindrae]|uniref:Uncharacterized protein n=1 Tax=Apiospora rasikravindrae TaxID=990691 RepID=A0ABR1SMD9_9PEZI